MQIGGNVVYQVSKSVKLRSGLCAQTAVFDWFGSNSHHIYHEEFDILTSLTLGGGLSPLTRLLIRRSKSWTHYEFGNYLLDIHRLLHGARLRKICQYSFL